MADITWDIDPAREAKLRCTAKVEVPMDRPLNKLAEIRRVVEELTRMNVPDDAYVNINVPYAWASWERPYTAANVEELKALRYGAHDHHGAVHLEEPS